MHESHRKAAIRTLKHVHSRFTKNALIIQERHAISILVHHCASSWQADIQWKLSGFFPKANMHLIFHVFTVIRILGVTADV